jgi:hypothetical protein
LRVVIYLNYENTKIEKFNYFKGDYDKLRQELDIDWNEILNDKNTTDMIDIVHLVYRDFHLRMTDFYKYIQLKVCLCF